MCTNRLMLIASHSSSSHSFCVCSHLGESMVPEQEDEVEAREGRPAGGSCKRKRTGECKKRNVTSIRDFRDSRTAALGQLSQADTRGGQPGQ